MNVEIETAANAHVSGTGVALTPSKIPWARVVFIIAVFLILAVVLGWYYKHTFTGLTDREAMDIAQVARNLSKDKGYTTCFLRPLNAALVPLGDDGVIELNHPPLYPYVLSQVFKHRVACDQMVVWASLAFFFFTVLTTYALGWLLFDWRAGLLAATVVCLSAQLLDIAAGGTEWPMAALLFSLLLIAVAMHHRCATSDKRRPALACVALAAVLVSALYMTHHILVMLVIPVAIYFGVTGGARRLHAAAFLALVIVLSGYWGYRNAELTGFPVLGITAWDLMADSRAFPRDVIYRSTDAANLAPLRALLFPIESFSAFGDKLILGCNRIIAAFIPLLGLVVMPFAVVSALYKFKKPAANAVRCLVYGIGALMVVCFALFSVNKSAVIVFAPVAAVFASAYFLLLLEAKKLHVFYVKVLVAGFVALTAGQALAPIFPAIQASGARKSVADDNYFSQLGERGIRTIIYTDTPWSCAWRTLCFGVWLPCTDADVGALEVARFPMRVIVLTPESDNYSSDEIWYTLHRVRIWRDYIRDPDQGIKKMLDEMGIANGRAKDADKYVARLRRNFAVSQSLAGFRLQRQNPFVPDDVQVLLSDAIRD